MNRDNTNLNDEYGSVAIEYCRIELVAAFLYGSALIATDTSALTFGVFLFNDKLPFNYIIPGLSFVGFSLNWAINYVHQVTLITAIVTFYLIHFLFTLILMNHSCFKVDCAMIHIKTLDNALNRGSDPPIHPLQVLSIAGNLRKVQNSIEDLAIYQKNATDFLKLILMAVLGSHCLILCFSIFALVHNSAVFSMALILMMTAFTELFVFCWMGSRLAEKLNTLTNYLHGSLAPQRPSHGCDDVPKYWKISWRVQVGGVSNIPGGKV